MKNDSQFVVRLPKKDLEKLNEVVKKNAKNRSELFRQWIKEYIEENETKMTNFKYVGKWNKHHPDIDMYEIDGEVYALHGWNGESYMNSWKCTGEYNMDASEEEYIITPISEEIEEDEFEIVGYEVR